MKTLKICGIYCPYCHKYIQAASLYRSDCIYCGKYIPDSYRYVNS